MPRKRKPGRFWKKLKENYNILFKVLSDEMPPLTHWRDRSQPWSEEQSDVCDFIARTAAELEVELFHSLNEMGKKCSRYKFIVFHPETQLWTGAKYRSENASL